MKLIVTEENGIEIVYLLVVRELGQMLGVDEDLKKQSQVKKNNLLSKTIYLQV